MKHNEPAMYYALVGYLEHSIATEERIASDEDRLLESREIDARLNVYRELRAYLETLTAGED